jgi:hypothetical protein
MRNSIRRISLELVSRDLLFVLLLHRIILLVNGTGCKSTAEDLVETGRSGVVADFDVVLEDGGPEECILHFGCEAC